MTIPNRVSGKEKELIEQLEGMHQRLAVCAEWGEVWRAGNTHCSHERPMTHDTRIALFLMGELVTAV